MNAHPRPPVPWWIGLVAMLTVLGAAAAPAPTELKPVLVKASTVPSCSWDKPGHDPYMGDVVSAVDRYQDMPAPVRERLKQRMAVRQYDDIAEISRDHIEGRDSYGPAITDMHFGTGRICKTVTRTKWTSDMRERGLVYCDGNDCIIVPTVCRNVSRVSKLATAPAVAEGPLPFDPPGAGLPAGLVSDVSPLALGLEEPLVFEAPQAGQDPFYSGSVPFYGLAGPNALIVTPAATSASQPTTPGDPTGGTPVVSPPVVTGAVPEPSTWGLMLGGAALLAAAQRRRRGAVNAGPATA